MTNKTIIIHPDGTHTKQVWAEGRPGLKFLNDAVGGSIEAVPYWRTWVEEDLRLVPCIVYCNEHGKLEEQSRNIVATLAWDGALKRITTTEGPQLFPGGVRDLQDHLVGSILILVGEPDFIDPQD